MNRDKADHDRNRKSWEKAFSVRALRGYEDRMQHQLTDLLNQIDNNVGKPFDIALWIKLLTFDVDSDLAFGQAFGRLKEGTPGTYMEIIETQMTAFGFFTHIPWFPRILNATPFLPKPQKEMEAQSTRMANERKKYTPEIPDIFSFLMDAYNKIEKPGLKDEERLAGDIDLISTTFVHLRCSNSSSLLTRLRCYSRRRLRHNRLRPHRSIRLPSAIT